MKQYKTITLAAVLIVTGAAASGLRQDSKLTNRQLYFDEPAWVHDRPAKLTDRIWHAKLLPGICPSSIPQPRHG